MSVYDRDAFSERVNYACRCLENGSTDTRGFETCFESFDDDAVVVAVYRRSLTNQKLADGMVGVLSPSTYMPVVDLYRNIPTGHLHKIARLEREVNYNRFENPDLCESATANLAAAINAYGCSRA